MSNNRKYLEETFKKWDKNGDGTLTRQEVRDALNEVAAMIGGLASEADVNRIMKKHDNDNDDGITLEEFCSVQVKK
ncbi:hypothetical protein SNEBB_000555 [Seison nebaliae]|nr:hypothetical protein SNEBB_000555 [Seison nebaliae]